MNRLIQLVVILSLGVIAAGCTTTGYWTDRGRDAADIFTAAVGKDNGVKVRAGPVHAGIYAGADCAGLRGGEFAGHIERVMTWTREGSFPNVYDVDITLMSVESFKPNEMPTAKLRNKHFHALGVPVFCAGVGPDSSSFPWYYYTQFEVCLGCLRGIRLGVNPGELLDFLLGWTTLDIFSDDL